MRTIWKGAINFGLVNIPIKLGTATSKKNIKFKNLHQECMTPITTKRFCPKCEKEVEYGQLVKGYEYDDNKYVVLKDDDFDNIPVKSTKTIDIIDFVKLEEIDPVYYIKTYYLFPNEGGEKPYFLLKKALLDTNKVAISKITIRNKESLAVIRVMEESLALETMFFADEVRTATELELEKMEKMVKISEKEVDLAIEIVNNLTAEFKAEKYIDEYRQELMNIIRGKIEGKEIEVPDKVVKEKKVVDLMEKLKASVQASEKQEKKSDKKRTG